MGDHHLSPGLGVAVRDPHGRTIDGERPVRGQGVGCPAARPAPERDRLAPDLAETVRDAAPPGFRLEPYEDVEVYGGWWPYDLPPTDPTWTGVADQERRARLELARREGQLARRERMGLGALLTQHIGYTGGVVMLVLAFFLISSWE